MAHHSTLTRSNSRVHNLMRLFDKEEKSIPEAEKAVEIESREKLPALIRDHTISQVPLYKKPSFNLPPLRGIRTNSSHESDPDCSQWRGFDATTPRTSYFSSTKKHIFTKSFPHKQNGEEHFSSRHSDGESHPRDRHFRKPANFASTRTRSGELPSAHARSKGMPDAQVQTASPPRVTHVPIKLASEDDIRDNPAEEVPTRHIDINISSIYRKRRHFNTGNSVSLSQSSHTSNNSNVGLEADDSSQSDHEHNLKELEDDWSRSDVDDSGDESNTTDLQDREQDEEEDDEDISNTTDGQDQETEDKDLNQEDKEVEVKTYSLPHDELKDVSRNEDNISQSPKSSHMNHTEEVSTCQTVPTPSIPVKPPQEVIPKEVTDYVGFSRVLSQIKKKAVRQGFRLNLLIVGDPGLGKSSLINSLFKAKVFNKKTPRISNNSSHHENRDIIEDNFTMVENGVELKVNLVTCLGFGNKIDNSECWLPIVDYIEAEHMKYLEMESSTSRQMPIPDTRPHACLYFLPPTGHGLRKLDTEAMKALHNQINIIPLIAKGDSFTKEELYEFKESIRDELKENNISIYHTDEDLDVTEPMAVISSNQMWTDEVGQSHLERRYPWGTIDIENKEFCDFSSLRKVLLHRNTVDLIDRTHSLHYHNFRSKKLTSINYQQLLVVEDTGRARLELMEREMEKTFQKKVDERLARLRRLEMLEERKLKREQESLAEQAQQLEASRSELTELKLSIAVQNRQKYLSQDSFARPGKEEGDRRFESGTRGHTMGLMSLRRIAKRNKSTPLRN